MVLSCLKWKPSWWAGLKSQEIEDTGLAQTSRLWADSFFTGSNPGQVSPLWLSFTICCLDFNNWLDLVVKVARYMHAPGSNPGQVICGSLLCFSLHTPGSNPSQVPTLFYPSCVTWGHTVIYRSSIRDRSSIQTPIFPHPVFQLSRFFSLLLYILYVYVTLAFWSEC